MLKLSILVLLILSTLTACTFRGGITSQSQGSSSLSECATDEMLSEPCTASTGQVVTSTQGADITSWNNTGSGTTISASIPDGYYQAKQCSFTDADLIATNIVSGVNIFGVLGTASGSYSACTDDALNTAQCSTAASRYVTATAGANVNGADGSLSATIPAGYYSSSQTATMSDADLVAGNIRTGINLFGTTGTYTGTFNLNTASNAYRDPGVKVIPNLADLTSTSAQITLNNELSLYAGADFPTTGGYNYRDIPDMNQDDEGHLGTNCKYAPRPSVDCGTSQATIALRIADCQSANPTTSSWNGATQCNGGQGLWRLVARQGANKEVWQDQRTGLLWSSTVNTAVNWFRATGNAQLTPLTFINSFNNTAGTPITGNGTIGALASGTSSAAETITITFTTNTAFTVSGANCGGGAITAGGLTGTAGSTVTWSRANYCSFTITQGSINFAANDKFTLQSVANAVYSCAAGGPLQPASPVSYCAEAAGLTSDAGENWVAGTYFAAKGGLGKNSTPAVRWRSPSIEDYMQANVNGIRFVMPDMGIAGASRPVPDGSVVGANEWSSSLGSFSRSVAWVFGAGSGGVGYNNRFFANGARCVGR